VQTLGELYDQLRSRRVLAQRVTTLVERDGLHPREALHVVMNPQPAGGHPEHADPDEIEARRRATREGKRAKRKEARREQRASAQRRPPGAAAGDSAGAVLRTRVLGLYRRLARRLHPDSPTAIRSLDSARIQVIWGEVQGAYASVNYERMLAISAWLDSVTEGSADASSAGSPPWDPVRPSPRSLAERYERLRALQRSCGALERRLARLEDDPAWGFARSPERKRRTRKQQATRALGDELAGVREALQALEDFFDAIGSPRPPRAGRRR